MSGRYIDGYKQLPNCGIAKKPVYAKLNPPERSWNLKLGDNSHHGWSFKPDGKLMSLQKVTNQLDSMSFAECILSLLATIFVTQKTRISCTLQNTSVKWILIDTSKVNFTQWIKVQKILLGLNRDCQNGKSNKRRCMSLGLFRPFRDKLNTGGWGQSL